MIRRIVIAVADINSTNKAMATVGDDHFVMKPPSKIEILAAQQGFEPAEEDA